MGRGGMRWCMIEARAQLAQQAQLALPTPPRGPLPIDHRSNEGWMDGCRVDMRVVYASYDLGCIEKRRHNYVSDATSLIFCVL